MPAFMSALSSPYFLRNVLMADAIVSFATGLLQLTVTGRLSELLGLPPGLLYGTGEFYLVYGAMVALLASRKSPPVAAVWLIIIGNALWAIATAGLLWGGTVAPTGLGKAYVLIQAVTVAVLAELQFFALRQRQLQVSAASA